MKEKIFLGNIDLSEEALNNQLREDYKESLENPENMSYWFPKISASTTRNKSSLEIPETKIIPIDFEWWKWLRSDNYTVEKIKRFNEFLVFQLGDFQKGNPLFMKTGIFSNKFSFHLTNIKDRQNIGKQFLDIYYVSMLFGADATSEAVFREMIFDKEERLKIYEGLPLRTEYRVFYDFDNKKVVGISNYWHPEVMTKGALNKEDFENYLKEKEKIESDFNTYKHYVAEQVKIFMRGCSNLSGKWSVDIMKNGEDFWLIDMARMERSALVKEIEAI